jgi:hypothetical protein
MVTDASNFDAAKAALEVLLVIFLNMNWPATWP